MKYIILTEIRELFDTTRDDIEIGCDLLEIDNVVFTVADLSAFFNTKKQISFSHMLLKANVETIIDSDVLLDNLTGLYPDMYITMDTAGRFIVDHRKSNKLYDKVMSDSPFFKDSNGVLSIRGVVVSDVVTPMFGIQSAMKPYFRVENVLDGDRKPLDKLSDTYIIGDARIVTSIARPDQRIEEDYSNILSMLHSEIDKLRNTREIGEMVKIQARIIELSGILVTITSTKIKNDNK